MVSEAGCENPKVFEQIICLMSEFATKAKMKKVQKKLVPKRK